MNGQRTFFRNLDLLHRVVEFLILAVLSDYLTKVAGQMLSSESKRANFSRNSKNERNTTVVRGHAEWNSKVPHASIILLSILAFCLVALFIMYLVLRRCERRLLDQLAGKGRKFSYSEVDSPESGLIKGRKISEEKDYELYPLTPNIEKRVNQDIHQKSALLHAAVMEVSVNFISNTGRIVVEIKRIQSVAKKLLRSGFASSVEIHARLQPLSDKFRYKTFSKPIHKAEFHERFAFDGFTKDDLRKCWFRFRLYSQRRLGKSKLLGQVNVGVTDFEVDGVWSNLNLDILPSEEVHKLLTLP